MVSISSAWRLTLHSAALIGLGLALACAMLPGAIGAGVAIPRGSLRSVVEACVVAQRFALAFPCLRVAAKTEGRARYAVLRVPASRTHLLVVPTDAVAGLEDPRLQAAPFGSLWADALMARPLVSEGAGFAVPSDAIGLAVNADRVRSQDQLHIHVECVRPRYLQAIRAQAASAGSDWAENPVLVAGDRFAVRRVDRDEIERGNLFASLGRAPSVGANLSGVGALLVPEGSSGERMLLLAALRQQQSVEQLLDHGCVRTKRLVEPRPLDARWRGPCIRRWFPGRAGSRDGSRMAGRATRRGVRADTMRILSIQYLRGLAAFAVLVAHSVQYPMSTPDYDWVRLGRLGVILFFVISGFVMVFVTGTGRFDGSAFLRRRIVRVVPLYWIATFATAALALAAPSLFKTSVFSVEHLVLSLLFIPHVSPAGDTAPLLKLGWTLNYEMFFYLVFAMLFFTTALRRVSAISAAFASFVVLGLLAGPQNVVLDAYASYMLLAFCAGAWLGILQLNGSFAAMPDRAGALLLALAALGCLGGFLLERGTRGAEIAGLSMILGTTALVAFGLQAERRLPHWSALEGLGDASYSIYLGHIYFIAAANAVAKRVFADALPLPVIVLVGLAAGTAGGLLFFVAVERPVLRLFGVRLARHESKPAGARASPARPARA